MIFQIVLFFLFNFTIDIDNSNLKATTLSIVCLSFAKYFQFFLSNNPIRITNIQTPSPKIQINFYPLLKYLQYRQIQRYMYRFYL